MAVMLLLIVWAEFVPVLWCQRGRSVLWFVRNISSKCCEEPNWANTGQHWVLTRKQPRIREQNGYLKWVQNCPWGCFIHFCHLTLDTAIICKMIWHTGFYCGIMLQILELFTLFRNRYFKPYTCLQAKKYVIPIKYIFATSFVYFSQITGLRSSIESLCRCRIC